MTLPLKHGSPNDFQTPPKALKPLLPYLNPKWTIWECAEGNGNISNALWQLGFNVIGSEKYSGKIPYEATQSVDKQATYKRVYNKDFLTWQPEEFDCIITNPPYSIKQQFLQRAYDLGKPFAFLLPLTTFETMKRQFLFERYGLEVILFDKRINFETPDGKGQGSWFATAWFTNWLKIGRQLTFVKLGENHEQESFI